MGDDEKREALRSELLQAMLAKYEPQNAPNIGFRWEAVREQPYKQIIEGLSKFGRMQETTDANYDSAFGFAVESNHEMIFLELSMVGPYAAIRRQRDDWVELIDRTELSYSPLIDAIIGLVRNCRFHDSR